MINKISNSNIGYNQYLKYKMPSFGSLKLEIKNRNAGVIVSNELSHERERELIKELIGRLKQGDFNFIGPYKKLPYENRNVFDSSHGSIILIDKGLGRLPEIEFLSDKTHTYKFEQSSIKDTFFYKSLVNALISVRNYNPEIKTKWVNPHFYDQKFTYVDFVNRKVVNGNPIY